MDDLYDYKKYAILYVDDEEKSLKYFARAFGEHFRILTATNARDGFEMFEDHQDEIGIIMTDQRMPGEKGVQLLERVRKLRPRTVRVLATAYSDLDAAIDAVNTGAIYKYVTKPWDIPQLETTLRRGLEFYIVQRERDSLMREKLSVLHNMMITDRVISLGIVAAGLGHYVRNSLVAVRTFLDLAPSKLKEENVDLEELRNPNFWRDFYSHVQGQIGRITELLNDIGVASGASESPAQEPVDLKRVIAAAQERLQDRIQEKGIRIENNIPDDLPSLEADSEKFQRLFILLLKDEIIHLPNEGAIGLTGRAYTEEPGAKRMVEISLRDNGPGLPKEALRSVFDPFFLRTDDPQQFGINLMACYFIVYHFGGDIQITSGPGQGTLFTLKFPVVAEPSNIKEDEGHFLSKVLMNETLWEKILAES